MRSLQSMELSSVDRRKKEINREDLQVSYVKRKTKDGERRVRTGMRNIEASSSQPENSGRKLVERR